MEKIMALDKWHLVTDKVTQQDIKDELERKIVVQEKISTWSLSMSLRVSKAFENFLNQKTKGRNKMML